MTDIEGRIYGSLCGLAVGDALGTTLEFKSPGTFEPITDMIGGGPFNLDPGQWTDDTSMALCLAASLIDSKGFDARDQMERYVRWWRNGYMSSTGSCFDIGNTVMAALLEFERSGDGFSGRSDPMSAGNGSLMRLAPIPLYWTHNVDKAVEMAGQSSRTTHAAHTAADACRYYASLIVGAVNGAGKEELLREPYEPSAGFWNTEPLTEEIDEVAHGSYKRKSPPEIRGTGYVVGSLEAALWAFFTTDDFCSGALAAVNLGDDADTTGAIYGQLAGAFYGIKRIPTEWIGGLALLNTIQSFARDFAERASGFR